MPQTQQTNDRRQPAERTGTVVSTGGHKTCHVVIESLVQNAQYGKYVRRRTKLAVHDETNQARLGDVVEIIPCRRISKSKAWRLLKVVRQGGEAAAS